jgi:hypothetical protein
MMIHPQIGVIFYYSSGYANLCPSYCLGLIFLIIAQHNGDMTLVALGNIQLNLGWILFANLIGNVHA